MCPRSSDLFYVLIGHIVRYFKDQFKCCIVSIFLIIHYTILMLYDSIEKKSGMIYEKKPNKYRSTVAWLEFLLLR